ncbi:hypothetical protein C8J56DRAFT_1026966 [Mycena floridula]|nr:hypothetical protein C8J56DRAFT_1026966 [Mycena floridula]
MLSLNLKFILPAILLVLTVNGATVTPSPVATQDLPCADGVHVSPDGHAVAVSPEHAVYFLPAKFAYSEEPRAYFDPENQSSNGRLMAITPWHKLDKLSPRETRYETNVPETENTKVHDKE